MKSNRSNKKCPAHDAGRKTVEHGHSRHLRKRMYFLRPSGCCQDVQTTLDEIPINHKMKTDRPRETCHDYFPDKLNVSALLLLQQLNLFRGEIE